MRDVRGSARRCACLLGLIGLAAGCLPATAPALEKQKIKFTSQAPTGAVVGGPTYEVTATGGGSGNPVTFAIDAKSTSVCTISGAVVSFIGKGTCTIDANQAGNAEFEAAPEVKQSFAVSGKPQAIEFTSPAPNSAVVGGPSYEVKATGGGSGNPVEFKIDPASASVCTISGATVSFIGKGNCTIDADQKGNSEYEAAPTKPQSFAVGGKPQEIKYTSSPPEGAVVGGSAYTVTATGGESNNPVTFTIAGESASVCTVSGSTVSFIGGGVCTIDANQAGNSEFEPAPEARQSFQVAKAAQSIQITTPAPAGATVGGAPYAVGASSSSGLPVVLSVDLTSASVCSISGATVSFIGAGTCTIDANQLGDGAYEPAAQVQQSFAVSPAVTINPPSSPPPPSKPPAQQPVATAATFKAVSARLHSPSFKITLQEQISDPGKLTWRLTFKNGTLGVFSARTKCKSGSVRLGGKCRPAQVVYGRGSATFASAGVVTITINPSNAAKKALRVAMQRKRNMRITALVTFLPTKGGASVSHTQVLTVRFATAR